MEVVLYDLRSERDSLKVELAENDSEEKINALNRKLDQEIAKKIAVSKYFSFSMLPY